MDINEAALRLKKIKIIKHQIKHLQAKMNTSDNTALEPYLPAIGWTTREPVPEGLIGSRLLFVGSEADKSELVIVYQNEIGENWRLALGFSELGMGLESVSRHHPNPGGEEAQS